MQEDDSFCPRCGVRLLRDGRYSIQDTHADDVAKVVRAFCGTSGGSAMTSTPPQPSPTVPSQPPSEQNLSGKDAAAVGAALVVIAAIATIFSTLTGIIDFLHDK